jgi:hypothetical protein
MSVNLSLLAGAGAQFFTNSGVPLAGGLLYTYAAGTTTPTVTYTSNTGATPNSNPIVLDSAGRVIEEIWLTTGSTYKFILESSTFVQIWSKDNIPGANDPTALNDFKAELANTSNPALGDALVGFRQSDSGGNLAGSVGRTVHQKLQEYVSVKDFGAIGDGVTDDTLAFNSAISFSSSSTNGVGITIPRGTYRITAALNTITKPLNWAGEGRSITRINFENCNGFNYDLSGGVNTFVSSTISDISVLTNTTSYTGIYFKGKQTFTPHDTTLHLKSVSVASAYIYNNGIPISAEWAIAIYIDDADEVVLDDCFIEGSNLNTNYSGKTASIGVKVVTCTGLKANFCNLYLLGIGFDVSGQSEGHIFQGCTVVAVDQGFYYHNLVNPANNHTFSDTHIAPYTVGINYEANAPFQDNAQSVFVSGSFILEREPNILKPSYTSIIFNCRYSTIVNCGLQSNTTLTPVRAGIYLTSDNNLVSNVVFYNPDVLFQVKSNGAGLYSQAANCTRVGAVTSLTSGDDQFLLLSSVPNGLSENTLRATTFNFQSLTKLQKVGISGSRLILGDRDSNVRFIDFLSNIGGTAAYDGRILSNGGGATTGQAEMLYYGASHNFSGIILPQIDNTYSCGTAANRWSQVFAANGTINTSDEREKQDIKDLTDAERQVAIAIKGLIKSFRFKDAVANKGEKARIHFGVMAQQVAEAFTSNGLDPHQYALFCYDEWDATEEILDDEGSQVKPAMKAGNRYGIRYEELLAFVISAL